MGTVEIGYSILPQWQRRGYATELAKLLLENAFSFLHVQRVIAQTTESNQASVAVLRACGFVAAGPGREIETLRFEASRPGRSNLSREIDDQPVQ